MTNVPQAPVEHDSRPGFASLTLMDWRQFDHVAIDFHPRLTVLTGANASGKSTILGILARHFAWGRAYSSSPIRTRSRDGEWVTVGRRRARRILRDNPWAEIGELRYGTGHSTAISVPNQVSAQQATQYDLLMQNQQPVTGAFLTSHRSVSGAYAPVTTIPTTFGTADILFEQFTNELRTRWQGGWTGKSPQTALKEALISAAVFGGPGNRNLEYNAQAHEIWEGFQRVLREVMPPSLGYMGMRVRIPDLIIETRTGDFIIDDASGGLSAIVEVAWQIFLRSRTLLNFTVLLDEPENHLHPSLQRELLPSLLRAFPNVQFIVATHSPFVVTSTPNSSVYALEYNPVRRVESRLLDYANKAASADETLRQVLGVESTTPAWAEAAFAQIVNKYTIGTLSPDRLQQMRRELAEMGLETEFTDAVLQVADASDPEVAE